MICPVPEDQLPINEYYKLTSVWDFSWACNSNGIYYKILFTIYSIITLFFFIFLNLLDPSYALLVRTFFLSALITFFICLRTYLGFLYVYIRLSKSTLPYEESSWYDGQIWIKNVNFLIKDRLIADYTVWPILVRLKTSLAFIILISILLMFSLFFN